MRYQNDIYIRNSFGDEVKLTPTTYLANEKFTVRKVLENSEAEYGVSYNGCILESFEDLYRTTGEKVVRIELRYDFPEETLKAKNSKQDDK